MGSLAGLANELLLESFGSLSNSDLKSIRLVCKQFERLANPHLFKTISLAPNEKAVNIFESIYQHPTIKQCVEEIVYDAAFYARDVAQDILEYQDQLSLLNFDVGDYSLWMAKIKEDVLRDFGKIIESDCVYAASNDPLFAKSFDSALKLGHEIYRSRYAEQNNTLQSGQISLHLSRGLAAMQKIKRIIIDDSLSSPRRDGLVIESTRMPILNRSQFVVF